MSGFNLQKHIDSHSFPVCFSIESVYGDIDKEKAADWGVDIPEVHELMMRQKLREMAIKGLSADADQATYIANKLDGQRAVEVRNFHDGVDLRHVLKMEFTYWAHNKSK